MNAQGIPSYSLLNSIVFDPKLNRQRASQFTSTFVKAGEPGSLGPSCAPFYPAGGSTLMDNMKLRTPTGRFDDRQALLAQLDQLRRRVDATGALDNADEYRQRAFDIIARGAVKAFDLKDEDCGSP